jgi:hypothetical protein
MFVTGGLSVTQWLVLDLGFWMSFLLDPAVVYGCLLCYRLRIAPAAKRQGGIDEQAPQLYSQLQDASKQKRDANIAAHKLRTGRVRHSVNRRKTLQQTNKQTPVPTVALDFLAIGDSWFEYPLYNEIPTPFQNNAIVAQSQLGSLGNPPPQILNQALHGQATTAILSYENQEKMISVLQDADQWLNHQTGLPDGILVSGGGDDLVGDQLAIYLDYGGSGLNVNRFQGVLDSVQASYMDLFAFRDLFAKGVPSLVIAMTTRSRTMPTQSAQTLLGFGHL